jgi:polyhydroxyalkanoate synthesis repressor PhaR
MLSKTDPPGDKKEPVVVKKYANRRLYNTETSTYVTLDDLAAMVRAERDFVVFDAKSGEDLTHSVLTQIIVEQESRAGAQTLLPVPFLRQLIRFYGDTMERMVPSYLQVSLETLAKEQERFRKQFATAFTPQGAFEAYQEQARKNLAMFEQAISMFAPFSAGKQASPTSEAQPQGERQEAGRGEATRSAPANPAPTGERATPASRTQAPADKRASSELDELKAQLAAMQAKLEKLSSKS